MRWAGPARTPSRLIRSSGPPDLHGSARHLRNNDLKLSFSPSHPSPPRLHPDTEGAHPSRRDKDRGGAPLRQTAARPYGGGVCVCRGGDAESGITVTQRTPRKPSRLQWRKKKRTCKLAGGGIGGGGAAGSGALLRGRNLVTKHLAMTRRRSVGVFL